MFLSNFFFVDCKEKLLAIMIMQNQVLLGPIFRTLHQQMQSKVFALTHAAHFLWRWALKGWFFPNVVSNWKPYFSSEHQQWRTTQFLDTSIEGLREVFGEKLLLRKVTLKKSGCVCLREICGTTYSGWEREVSLMGWKKDDERTFVVALIK